MLAQDCTHTNTQAQAQARTASATHRAVHGTQIEARKPNSPRRVDDQLFVAVKLTTLSPRTGLPPPSFFFFPPFSFFDHRQIEFGACSLVTAVFGVIPLLSVASSQESAAPRFKLPLQS